MPSNPYYQSSHWRELKAACRARAGDRCEVAGCTVRGFIADHIKTRPNVPYPCELDVLDNLRWICRDHDGQVKELPGGKGRAQGGRFRLRGCDAQGRSIDPNHRWKT
jgi:hypothetical protein